MVGETDGAALTGGSRIRGSDSRDTIRNRLSIRTGERDREGVNR